MVLILTYNNAKGMKLLKTADQFQKAVNLMDGGSRVWFEDGECIDCVETIDQIAEALNHARD